MGYVNGFFLAALFCSTVSLAQSPGRAAERIWIADATIISPEDLTNVTLGSVLIEDGRIVRVERNRRARAPAGSRVVSAKGQFLIPGLIDSHVHLYSVPGVGEGQQLEPAIASAYFEQLPRSYL